MKKILKAKAIPALKVTFGADPELMLFSTEENKIVSSIPVLKQDKNNPIDLGDGIKMYADNVLVETAFPPSKTKEGMLTLMQTVFSRMQEKLGDKYRLLPKAAHIFEPAQLKIEHGIDPFEIGCVPSIDVYEQAVLMPNGFPDGLRTGSFHIHLGNQDYNKKKNGGHFLTFNSRENTIKLMDVFVGCASILFDKDESSVTRRKLYGQAGNFRITPYGIEWRTLGNYALTSRTLTEFVLDLVGHVVSHVNNGTEQDILKLVDPTVVREAINTCNIKLAEDILIKALLPANLLAAAKADYGVPDFNKSWGI